MRLDDVVPGPVDLVKIDVEGAEPLVLRGMTTLLATWRPAIIVELNEYWLREVSSCSSGDVLELLRSFDYDVITIESFLAGRRAAAKVASDDVLFVQDVVCLPCE